MGRLQRPSLPKPSSARHETALPRNSNQSPKIQAGQSANSWSEDCRTRMKCEEFFSAAQPPSPVRARDLFYTIVTNPSPGHITAFTRRSMIGVEKPQHPHKLFINTIPTLYESESNPPASSSDRGPCGPSARCTPSQKFQKYTQPPPSPPAVLRWPPPRGAVTIGRMPFPDQPATNSPLSSNGKDDFPPMWRPRTAVSVPSSIVTHACMSLLTRRRRRERCECPALRSHGKGVFNPLDSLGGSLLQSALSWRAARKSCHLRRTSPRFAILHRSSGVGLVRRFRMRRSSQTFAKETRLA